MWRPNRKEPGLDYTEKDAKLLLTFSKKSNLSQGLKKDDCGEVGLFQDRKLNVDVNYYYQTWVAWVGGRLQYLGLVAAMRGH